MKLKSKKIIVVCTILIVLILTGIIVIAFTLKNNSTIYDVYPSNDKVIYMSSHYSQSQEAFTSEILDTKFIIDEDVFKIESTESSCTLKDFDCNDPQYIEESISNKIKLDEKKQLNLKEYSYYKCYSVKDSNGIDTYYKIYVIDNEIWLGHWDKYGENHDELMCEYIISIERDVL